MINDMIAALYTAVSTWNNDCNSFFLYFGCLELKLAFVRDGMKGSYIFLMLLELLVPSSYRQ